MHCSVATWIKLSSWQDIKLGIARQHAEHDTVLPILSVSNAVKGSRHRGNL